MSWIDLTTKASLLVQGLTWVIQVQGLRAAKTGTILWGGLWLETIVQVVEGLFYTAFLALKPTPALMMIYRYLDWFLTTPTMLVSLSAYLTHINQRGKGTWKDFWAAHGPFLKKVLALNFVMLAAGFSIRLGILPGLVGWPVGWAAFFAAFFLLAQRFGWDHGVLRATFVIWSLYGVGDVLSDARANVLINGLDLVAKNLFGLLLSREAFRSN